MLLLKYSILCLYLRIFPHVWLKRAVFAFMAFTACFVVPLLLTAAVRCDPVRAQWDLEAAKTAKCLDWLAILKLTVVYEIIAEIILFALPVPVVLGLQMATAKKIQLIVFFGLGLLQVDNHPHAYAEFTDSFQYYRCIDRACAVPERCRRSKRSDLYNRRHDYEHLYC
jgi:hypothetical protein